MSLSLLTVVRLVSLRRRQIKIAIEFPNELDEAAKQKIRQAFP